MGFRKGIGTMDAVYVVKTEISVLRRYERSFRQHKEWRDMEEVRRTRDRGTVKNKIKRAISSEK